MRWPFKCFALHRATTVHSSLQTALATVDSLSFSFVIRKREEQSERERREGREGAEYENEEEVGRCRDTAEGWSCWLGSAL